MCPCRHAETYDNWSRNVEKRTKRHLRPGRRLATRRRTWCADAFNTGTLSFSQTLQVITSRANMSQLQRLLEACHRGEADFEALDAAVDARLRDDPRSGAEVLALLDTALGAGLPRTIHQTLVAKIGRHTAARSSAMTRDAAGDPGRGDDRAPLETGFVPRSAASMTSSEAAEETGAHAALTTTGGFPGPAEDDSPELGEGDHLRGRFELITKLGEGGMGAVWKGKDLLKEEAKDRNPFVAIKLLQKNFKEHPDAFVALQRETAKQQRLAHPNVATVFSFDRDTDSGAVFMSMDLLEGESLDAFIRNMPEGGLAEQEAMSIIQQLAEGLAYAHKNGLVHSDLKPGNCFLTRDGTVKLLDFGIARASKTKVDAEGVTTLFDPAELGAITPAYATVEMFEGQEPDPRDDIYALGIMAYQLLTGRHPYDKMSAPRARDQGLVPEPVSKLSKRQNRALARALALDRNERTASVDEFIEDIRRKHNLRGYGIAASVIVVVLIAALAYAQIVDFVRGEEDESIISVLERGGIENIAEGLAMIEALESEDRRRDVLKDPRTREAVVNHIDNGGRHSVREGLALIRPFDPAWQHDILEDPKVRIATIEYYDQRIDAAFNPSEGKHDYGTASELLENLAELYPNSASVVNIRAKITERHQEALERLTKAYDELLGDLQFSAENVEAGIDGVLRAIRNLDPAHPTLKDPRLADAVLQQTREALDSGDLTRARIIMNLAVELVPNDPSITQLSQQLAARLEHQRQDNLAVELRARLERERASLNTLADFRRMQGDLMMLASLRPRDSMLRDLRWQLKQIFISEFDASMTKQRFQAAEDLLVDFARFFEIPYVESQRDRLGELMKTQGYRIPASASRHNELTRRAKVINEKLRQPLLTPEWEAEFETAFKESLAMIGAEGSGVQLIRRTMMLLYRDRAVEAVRAKQYVRARNLISKGRDYVPDAPELDEVDRSLVESQQTVLMKKNVERRNGGVAEIKMALLAHAAAGRPDEAAQALQALVSKLPANDPFITESAQPAVAGAYLESAAKSRAAGDFESAVRQLERALAVSPTREVRKALDVYSEERMRADLTASIVGAMDAKTGLDVATLNASIATHREQFPGQHEALTAELVALATARLVLQTGGARLDGGTLRRELDLLSALFPNSATSLENETATAVEQRATALASSDTYAAYDYVASALIALPQNRVLSELYAKLPPRDIAKVRNDIDAGRLSAARASLRTARARHPRHEEIPKLTRELEARMNDAERAYAIYVQGVKKRDLSGESERRAALAAVHELWSDNRDFRPVAYREARPGECTTELAGRGRENGGICFDLIADDVRGTPMVVVPNGGNVAKPYAIGKYETSIAEFNTFCERSGQCRPLDATDPRLPVTGVTRQLAERYARWLSEQASARSGERVVYRLPTEAEWQHAARADGLYATKGINCRPSGKVDVDSGLLGRTPEGSVALGLAVGRSLVSVTFGDENGWGVVNPAGNAQEWVVTQGGLAARGGAYTDKVSRCTVAFSRSHDGRADERTGFRLLRELD